MLGQAAQGISAGLGGLSTLLGGAGNSARQAVQGLGVRGLDAGAGCGVLAGYFFGAGLMLKPSALEQVAHVTTSLVGEFLLGVQKGTSASGRPHRAVGATHTTMVGAG